MKNLLKYAIMSLIALITLLLIFSPNISIIQSLSEYTVHIMFGFLFLGLGCLLFDQKQLLFASFIATGVLALFLKDASNSDLRFPKVDIQSNIRLSHFNLSNVDHDLTAVLEYIKTTSPDIISFQEYTPDWVNELNKALQPYYEHSKKMVRIDPFGIAIFSKYTFDDFLISNYKDIPNISFKTNINNINHELVYSYMLPPALDKENRNLLGHLDFVGDIIHNSNLPAILIGDFNVVYWSKEITNFRNKYAMNNSRKASSAYGLSVPYDHMLYTRDLQCSSFQELVNHQGQHIGISGVFQPTVEISTRTYGVIE